MSEIEVTQWALPPSNAGSSAASAAIRGAFGRGKWDKPIQIAALLDSLISLTEDMIEVWNDEKPMLPGLTDPAGTWKSIAAQLKKGLTLYKYWRAEVGRVTQWDNPEAIAETITDPLLYGNWTFYEESGLPYPPGMNKNSLPPIQIPYSAGVQMDVVVKHNVAVFKAWVTDDLPASVSEGLELVGVGIGKAGAAVAGGAARGIGGLPDVFGTMTWKGKLALGGIAYLVLANAGLLPKPREIFGGKKE